MAHPLVKAAAVQMTSTADVAANLAATERLTRSAAADGAGLIVLPECFACLGPERDKLAIAESLPAVGSGGMPDGGGSPGPILARCQSLARELGVELVLGGFWERGASAERVRAACVHLGAGGEVRAVYRKIHLFDVDLPDGSVIRESNTIEPGDEVVATDTAAGRLGLSICYDVRFPELYRRLVDEGATLLTVPAAFTATTGKDHWHVLLRARAIESQCYLIAAAQCGHHFGNRHSYGHALICDPWGRVLSECESGEGYAIAEIDPAEIARVRAAVPSLAHRRL